MMGAWYSRGQAEGAGEEFEHQTIGGELDVDDTSPPSPAFDADDKPSTPGLYSFDTPFSASAFRPPVWTGASNPDAGLLGFQAPAADGLDESHDNHETLSSRSPIRQRSWRLKRAVPKTKRRQARKTPPVLPPEVHIQILSHLTGGGPTKQSNECTFCRLFALSRIARVSVLHRNLIESYLYPTLDLTCTACPTHHHLSSPITQLKSLLPLLLRTLSSRPDLAASITTILLPPSKSFLTCTIEKSLLPSLLCACPNVHHITGLAGLLERPFFAGEHYCHDDDTQHGILAKAVLECASLHSWAWNGGNAAGRDWDARIWDHHPETCGIDFAGFHSRWRELQRLEIVDVWNLTPECVAQIMRGLPRLRSVMLLGVRKNRVGKGEVGIVVGALEALGDDVEDVTVGDVEDTALLGKVGRWVGGRGSGLKRLGFRRVPVTVEGVEELLECITTEEGLWRGGSVVRCLEVEEHGLEGEVMEIGRGRLELRGLKELVWRCQGLGLGQVLKAGGMVDLRMLEVEEGQADNIVASRPGLTVLRWKRA